MPKALQICSTSECVAVAGSDGKCKKHGRKPWENISARNRTLPRDWKRRRAFVLRRDRRTCYVCGLRATQVDHVLSVARGGSHDYSNLAAICIRCHILKTNAERRKFKNA